MGSTEGGRGAYFGILPPMYVPPSKALVLIYYITLQNNKYAIKFFLLINFN